MQRASCCLCGGRWAYWGNFYAGYVLRAKAQENKVIFWALHMVPRRAPRHASCTAARARARPPTGGGDGPGQGGRQHRHVVAAVCTALHCVLGVGIITCGTFTGSYTTAAVGAEVCVHALATGATRMCVAQSGHLKRPVSCAQTRGRRISRTHPKIWQPHTLPMHSTDVRRGIVFLCDLRLHLRRSD